MSPVAHISARNNSKSAPAAATSETRHLDLHRLVLTRWACHGL